MVVSEVVSASTEDAGEEQLACEGPQNGELTVLSCIDDADVDDALERLDLGGGGGGDDGDEPFSREEGSAPTGGLTPTGSELALWGPLGMGLLVPVVGARRRRSRRRR